jgi:hypothetical protein
MRGLQAMGRRNRIAGFFCTDHFLEMVWMRNIEVKHLDPILRELPKKRPERFCLVARLIEKHKNNENALILMIHDHLLITGFFTHFESYRRKNKKDQFLISDLKYKGKP